MTIDELLCKFQGLHWHKGITYPDGAQSRYKCSCMEHQSIDPLSSLNPDFSDDHTAMELLRWIEENKLNMWKAFIEWARPAYVHWCWDYLLLLWVNNKVDADSKSYMRWVVLLAEWLRLEETRNDWGWEEVCSTFQRETNPCGSCTKCNGSGKIRSEWAREEGRWNTDSTQKQVK